MTGRPVRAAQARAGLSVSRRSRRNQSSTGRSARVSGRGASKRASHARRIAARRPHDRRPEQWLLGSTRGPAPERLRAGPWHGWAESSVASGTLFSHGVGFLGRPEIPAVRQIRAPERSAAPTRASVRRLNRNGRPLFIRPAHARDRKLPLLFPGLGVVPLLSARREELTLLELHVDGEPAGRHPCTHVKYNQSAT